MSTPDKQIQEIASRLLDDGAIGDWFRGELCAVACDDSAEWVRIASGVIGLISEGIKRVVENELTN